MPQYEIIDGNLPRKIKIAKTRPDIKTKSRDNTKMGIKVKFENKFKGGDEEKAKSEHKDSRSTKTEHLSKSIDHESPESSDLRSTDKVKIEYRSRAEGDRSKTDNDEYKDKLDSKTKTRDKFKPEFQAKVAPKTGEKKHVKFQNELKGKPKCLASNAGKVLVYSASPMQNKRRVSSTALILSQFEEEIRNKQKISKKLQEKVVTRTRGAYRRMQRKEMGCPLCNMRLDSNNNLVKK